MLRRWTVASTTTMTVYAFGLEEHLYSGAGVNQGNTYYYSLAGHLVGESTGSGTNMFLTDALGSVITTLSATAGSASVQGDQAYGPYGNARYQAGTMGTAKGFTGQYQDATGLDYYNARYYDPVVGRFLSADTVEGNGLGMDPYAYVGGNPETHNDPTGHCAWYDILCDLQPGWNTAAQNYQNAWKLEIRSFKLIWNGVAYAAQQTGQVLVQAGKNIIIAFILIIVLTGVLIAIIWNAAASRGGKLPSPPWDQEKQQYIAARLDRQAAQARQKAIKDDPSFQGSNAGGGALLITGSTGNVLFDSSVIRLAKRGAKDHVEDLVIAWAIGIIEGLQKKGLLAGATINLLIFTQTPLCDRCQGNIEQWLEQLLLAAGGGALVYLYIWRKGNPNNPKEPQHVPAYP